MTGPGKEEASKRLGITSEVYDDLYADFLALARENAVLIGEASAQCDWTRAGKIAHSIKGMAGNLGVAGVFESARDAERAAIEGRDSAVIAERIQDLTRQISQL